MGFLPNQIDLFEDEALESALLRLCRVNHFEHYSDLSIEVKSWLEEHYPTLAGVFPVALDTLNIHHSKQSSAQRVQALQLLEQLVGLPRFSLLDICFKHTNTVDLGKNAVVRYKQVSIPKELLRSANIPICPECLVESAYVRFDWHITKVTCCQKHGARLLTHCPSCHSQLNYMISEDPSVCHCGHRLTEQYHRDIGFDGWRDDACYEEVGACSLSEKLSLLTFCDKFFPNTDYGEFINSPLNCIEEYLRWVVDQNVLLATEKFNQLSFAQLTNNFLNDVSSFECLPVKIKECISYSVITLANNQPRSNIANIGDTFVSVKEAAFILASDVDEVYRLYETGILVIGKRLRNEGKLESHNAVFRLRDVTSLALSYSIFGFRQSAW